MHARPHKRFGASRAKARWNSFCLLFEIEAKRASHSARSAVPRDPMISQSFLMSAGIRKGLRRPSISGFVSAIVAHPSERAVALGCILC